MTIPIEQEFTEHKYPRLWDNGLSIREYLYQLAEALRQAVRVTSGETRYPSGGGLWPSSPGDPGELQNYARLREEWEARYQDSIYAEKKEVSEMKDIPEGTLFIKLSDTLARQIAEYLTAIADALEY